MLRLGVEGFEPDIGIFSIVRGNSCRVVSQLSPPDAALTKGAEFPLGAVHCSQAITTEGPFGLECFETADFSSHPAYRTFRLESEFTVPTRVRVTVFGTIDRASPAPRSRAFSAIDMNAQKPLASWFGSKSSRRQTDDELVAADAKLKVQVEGVTEALSYPETHLGPPRSLERTP